MKMKPKTFIMKQKLLLFIILVTTSLSFAQNTITSRIGGGENGHDHANGEKCLQQEIHDHLMETDPQYKAGREGALEMSREILQNIDEIKAQRNTYTIPVVFHVIHKGEPVGQGTNLSDAQLESAIVALNRDFAATGADGGIAQSSVPVAAGNTGIQFCLANKDPQGNPHSGINRVNGTSVSGYATSGITTGGGSNEVNVKSLSRWDNRYYLNVWVVSEIDNNGADAANPNSFAGGTLGFAYLPQQNVTWNAERDGVVAINVCVGNDPNGSQGFRLWQAGRLNRTLTHEVGHYLDLDHTFVSQSCAAESNCNTEGDRCCDTPPTTQNTSFNACNSPACNGTQQVENYMDYTGETCYDMFSEDQLDLMIAALEGPRNAVWNTDNCGPSIVADYDAGIVDIVNPEGSLCSSSFTPVVTLRNYGGLTLTSVTINYSWGSVNDSFNWTGNLGAGSTVDVTLPVQNAQGTGNFTFTASTASPSGQADEESGNDESTSDFTIAGDGGAVDFTLELDCYGDETSWDIKNDNNEVIASGSGYSTSAQQQTINEELCLADGCYTFTINDSFGDGLNGSTEANCNIDGDYFMVDDQGDYLFELTDLNFGGQAVHEFCINAEPSDPVDPVDPTDPVSTTEFNVYENVKLYPNPTSGSFTLAIDGLNENVEVFVMDVTGRIVVAPKTYFPSEQGDINLDITEFGKGVYMVVFQNNSMKYTRRVTLK